jgi:hypothetical protein
MDQTIWFSLLTIWNRNIFTEQSQPYSANIRYWFVGILMMELYLKEIYIFLSASFVCVHVYRSEWVFFIAVICAILIVLSKRIQEEGQSWWCQKLTYSCQDYEVSFHVRGVLGLYTAKLTERAPRALSSECVQQILSSIQHFVCTKPCYQRKKKRFCPSVVVEAKSVL